MTTGDGTGRMDTFKTGPVGAPRGLHAMGYSTGFKGERFGEEQAEQVTEYVRDLDITDERVLILAAQRGVSTMELHRTVEIAEAVLSKAGSQIPLIPVPANQTIQSVSKKRMKEYGWVQVAQGQTGETIDVASLAESSRGELVDAGWLPPDADHADISAAISVHSEALAESGFISTAELLDEGKWVSVDELESDGSDWVHRNDVAVRVSEL